MPRTRAGMSSSIAELIAAYSPPMPKPVKKRQKANEAMSQENAVATVATRYTDERDEEHALAAEAVGQATEEQRAEHRAGDVGRGRPADLARAESPSVSLRCNAGPSEPTTVTSSPSRSQLTPSAITTRQCQPDQGRRSRRAGMSLRTRVIV